MLTLQWLFKMPAITALFLSQFSAQCCSLFWSKWSVMFSGWQVGKNKPIHYQLFCCCVWQITCSISKWTRRARANGGIHGVQKVTVGCGIVSYKSNERVDARPVALDRQNNATLNADQHRTKTIDLSGNRSVVSYAYRLQVPDESGVTTHHQPRHGRICEIEATAVTIKYQQARRPTTGVAPRQYSSARQIVTDHSDQWPPTVPIVQCDTNDLLSTTWQRSETDTGLIHGLYSNIYLLSITMFT